MWLIKIFGTSFKWLSHLCVRVYRVAPTQTVGIVSSLLFSNIFLILTFFLPLKIIILVGSDEMPWYFSKLFGDIEKVTLVYWLVFATTASYILHLSFDYTSGIQVDKGTSKLLKRSDKLLNFSNFVAETNNFYKKICDVQSSILFVVIGGFATAYMSPSWFAHLTLFLLFSFIIISLSGFLSTSIIIWIKHHSKMILRVISSMAFLVFFGSIINSFLSKSENANIIIAIISMLLVRQVLQKLVLIIQDNIYLVTKKEKVNHVLYFNAPLTDVNNVKSIWSLLSDKDRNKTLSNYCGHVFARNLTVIKSHFFQLGLGNIIGFKISLDEKIFGGGNQHLFIKIFSPKFDYLASHESELYKNKISKLLPTLNLVAKSNYMKNYVLIFDDFRDNCIDSRAVQAQRLEILIDCWGVSPDKNFIAKYNRSHKRLINRIDEQLISRLRGACNSQDHNVLLDGFIGHLKLINKIINTLPVFIYNPNLNIRTIVQNNDSNFVVTDWSRWAIEPIGYGWGAVNSAGLALLHDRFTEKMKNVEVFSDVRVEYVQMAALIYNFDRLCRGHNYHDAFIVLSEIEILVDYLQSSNLSTSA